MKSLNARLFVIGFLTLVLLIPSAFVGALVSERQSRRQEAIAEVGGRWGNPQIVTGPVLQVPYRKYLKDEKGETRTVVEHATFLPEALEIGGSLNTEVRRRGIYDVVLYRAALTFKGRFGRVAIDEQAVAKADVMWDRAFVAIGITDPRGIEERVQLDYAGARFDLGPGVAGASPFASGIHSPVPVKPEGAAFAFALNLRGHDSLHLVPIGARTNVTLRSPWPHPSFTGAFLPGHHTLDARGFVADWSVLDLNRGFPQSWLGGGVSMDSAAFGVQLMQPVDGYAKSDRAHKYAILIIAMTFVTLLFIEMLKKEHVHALNYILTGLAVCLFYVLLLSLSEHVGFDLAYLVAATATTALVTWHARNILTRASLCRAVGATLTGLYAFMFVLLQLQDFALLVGAAGLFAMLAGVMAAASRITASDPA